MEDELHKRVIGQERPSRPSARPSAAPAPASRTRSAPSGSFIFLGPSGVGKTELAKTLAEFLFGDEDAMISLDMSEYMEKHTVSRLVGSPPGYVGYEEGGQLTEAVRRKPFSVVLFDEIEKAHPDVFNTLLQILEEGRLTDSQGRSVDFRNTVLIMTSNLGTAISARPTWASAASDEAVSYEKMKEKVNEALKAHFRPEFLNRIDETIVFHELSKPRSPSSSTCMIKRHRASSSRPGHRHRAHRRRQALLAERGYDPTLGARPLRRAIQRMVEDPLSRTAALQGVPGRRRRRAGPRDQRDRHDVPLGRGLHPAHGRRERGRRAGRGRPRRRVAGTATEQVPSGAGPTRARPPTRAGAGGVAGVTGQGLGPGSRATP
jgi:ATP-dependent Clp protease ATP-binding subunit ClpC